MLYKIRIDISDKENIIKGLRQFSIPQTTI